MADFGEPGIEAAQAGKTGARGDIRVRATCSGFRPADVGMVVALVTAINQAVFAFAPPVFGWLRDLGGSYIAPFLLAAAAQAVAAVIVAPGQRFFLRRFNVLWALSHDFGGQ